MSTEPPPPPAAGYQPQTYVPGQPQYSPYAAGPRTNSLAIVALVLGFMVPLGGIIAGHIALSQIKRTGEAGHGLALAGVILGYSLSALILIAVVLYILFFVVLFGTLATTGQFS